MAQGTTTARELARRSQAAVAAKDRDAWLSLFASDAVVQDPIGPSPLDPLGADKSPCWRANRTQRAAGAGWLPPSRRRAPCETRS